MNRMLTNYASQLKSVQEGRLWMGQNYKQKLASVDAQTAFRRPLPELHSPAEILSHLTVWREDAILKIQSGKGSLTDQSPENWKSNEDLKELGWEKMKQDYEASIHTLIELLKGKDDVFLEEIYYDPEFKGHFPYRFVIEGILQHDIYHLGQLGIILKFLKEHKT